MGRRRFSVDDNGAVAFDSRCLRSDGRRWRCPMPALPNNIFCALHRSLSRRPNAINSPSNVSDLELPHPDPDLIVELDTEKIDTNEDLLPRRRKKKRKGENGADAEASALDSNSDLVVESDSALEKLNRILDPVETEKKRPRKENGADLDVAALHRLCSDQQIEADSDLEKVNRVLDPPAEDTKSQRKENGAPSDRFKLDRNSDLPTETEITDSGVEKANWTVDSKKKKRRKEKGDSRKREKEIDKIRDKEADLIRMAMKRQMERRDEREEKKRSEKQVDEVRRELPNGVMAISSTPVRNSSNVDRIIDKKIGSGSNEGGLLKRRFRSKNVEPQPVGSVKMFPRVLGMSKNISGEKKTVNGIKKSSKTGVHMGAENSAVEESRNGQNKSGGIRCTDYSISQLLPLLKQLNWEQIFELEIEANNQGRGLAGIQLQVIECSNDVRFKCHYCRISIVNLHRSCSKCHYKLCPSCCREVRGESLPDRIDIVASEHPKKEGVCKNVTEASNEIRKELSLDSPVVHVRSDKKRDENIPCPPSALGGCGDGILNMKLLVPFDWTQKPCSTKQIVSDCDQEGCTNGG